MNGAYDKFIVSKDDRPLIRFTKDQTFYLRHDIYGYRGGAESKIIPYRML